MKETLTYNLNTLWISSRIAGGWKLKWLRLGWGSAAAADEGISPRISRALRELCMNYLRFPNCSRLRNPDSRFPNTNPVRPADAIDAVPLLQAKQTQLFSNNPCSTLSIYARRTKAKPIVVGQTQSEHGTYNKHLTSDYVHSGVVHTSAEGKYFV